MADVPVREKRSRRVLLWGVVFFALIQQAGTLLMDYRWQHLRFPMAAERIQLVASCPPPDVILFGSSRFHCIDTRTVEASLREAGVSAPVHVFNASVEAGDLVTAEYMLTGLLEMGVKPRQLVIEVSPETVTHGNRWILYHLGRQMTWIDVPTYLPDIVREGHVMRLFKARLLPFYTYRQNIWKVAAHEIEHVLSPEAAAETPPVPAPEPTGPQKVPVLKVSATKPWVEPVPIVKKPLPPSSVSASPQTVGNEKSLTHWLEDYEAGGGISQAALERIVGRCRERGIHVLLVGVPVSSAHRKFYTPVVERAFRNHMEYFVKTHGCGFVDCRDKVADNCFADHHHLNLDGTRFFSAYLAKEVLAPYWMDSDRVARAPSRDR